MATSRSSGLHAVELGEVRVDDRRQRHLPELDLLLEDQVQEEVERAPRRRGCGPRTASRSSVPDADRRTASRSPDPGSLTRHAARASRASSPPGRSTSATTSARCGTGWRPRTQAGSTRRDALLRRRPPRDSRCPATPTSYAERDPPHRDAAARRRPRPRALHPVRAEPRARAHRAHLDPQLRRDLRRAAPHDAVQGQVGRARSR